MFYWREITRERQDIKVQESSLRAEANGKYLPMPETSQELGRIRPVGMG